MNGPAEFGSYRKEDSKVVVSGEKYEDMMCAVMEATQAEELDKLYQGDQNGVGSQWRWYC